MSLLLLSGITIYGLFRFQWNDYGFVKTHELQKITGAIKTDDTLLLTSSNPYLFVSKDGGTSWKLEMFNLDQKENSFTDLDVQENNAYFVSRSSYGGNITPRFLYHSDTSGQDWTKIDLEDLTPQVAGISVESFIIKNRWIQFLDENENMYYQSDDFGKTWTESNTSITHNKTNKKNHLSIEAKDKEILIKKGNQGKLIAKVNKEFELSLFGNVTFKN